MTTTADNQVDAEEIVEEALDAAAPQADPTQAHIDDLVAKAQIALKEYASFNQEQIDYIVAKSAVAALDKHGDLAELAVDSSSLAPDGYTFSSGADGYRGNVFDGLFFGSSRYQVQAELIKDGRSIRLPNTDGAHYGNTVRFVGWVLP